MDFIVTYTDETGLQHHGILGQKWGVRRYQNEDGSLTPAGKERYADDLSNAKNDLKRVNDEYKKISSTITPAEKAAKYSELADAKARLAAVKALSKGKDPDSAEEKVYATMLQKAALAKIPSDKAIDLMNHLSDERGKEYVSRIMARSTADVIKKTVSTAAFTAGTKFVMDIAGVSFGDLLTKVTKISGKAAGYLLKGSFDLVKKTVKSTSGR